MIDFAVSQEKNMDPSVCTNEILATDKWEEHVRGTCARFI